MGFLVRLFLTVLLAPIGLIIGFSPSFLWEGYGEERATRKREKAAKAVAEWMAAHPLEAARIGHERRRRLIVEKEARRAKLAAEEDERQLKLAAEEEERRKAQQALEAALAIPLSEEKAKLLSKMPFSPSLADLQRFADER